MVNEGGAPVTVDRADVKEALDAGFKLESADSVERRNVEREYSDLASKAAAFGEGAVEGATVGLGTAGLAAIMGDEYREDARLREEFNHYARMAGELVGTVAPVLASGGTGAVARGVSAVGAPARGVAGLGNLAERGVAAGLRGILGESRVAHTATRAASMGAAGAVEGAAYGLGGSIADAALEDTDWTAERALSAMADGTWYGLGAGATIGGASSVLGAAGRAALGKMYEGQTFKQALGEFAERRATKQIVGNNARIYNELTDFGSDMTRVQRMGRKLLDENVPLGDLNQSIKVLDGKTESAALRLKTVAEELDNAGVKVNAQQVLTNVDQQIADLRKVGLGSHNKVANALEREVAPLRKRLSTRDVPMIVEGGGRRAEVTTGQQLPDEFTFTEWWRLRQNFDKTLNWAKRSGDPATDNLRKLRTQIDQGLDEAIARHADEQAKRLAVDGANAPQAQQAGALGGAWKKAKQDYQDFVSLREAAEEQLTRQEKNRFVSPSDYGTGGILGAIAATADGGVSALAGMAGGAATSVAHKFVRERGGGWLARAADAIANLDVRTTQAAKVLAGSEKSLGLGRAATRAATLKEKSDERRKRFRESYEYVRRFQRDPTFAAAQIERIIAPLAREQPEVASKLAERYQRDMAFLASKLPTGSSSGAQSFQPLKEQSFFSREDQQSFLAVAKTLADPVAAIESIAEGNVDLDVIETLKIQRPLEFAALRERVMLECASSDEEMTFKRKNFLSQVFDFVGDPSLDPATMLAIQESVSPPPEQQQGAPSGGTNVDGEKLTSPMALPSQSAGV
jgi:hypothetical protein